MNILFLTTGELESIEAHSIYPDLLRCFRNHGHNVYSVSTYERRVGKETEYIEENGHHALRVKTGNLTKCGTIEKGISTLLIELQYKTAIKKYLSDIKFDLVLYSTPPITLVNVIKYVKKRDNAKTYLLLKDIFPQNAVDLGMMQTNGVMGLVYKYFRNKERGLYAISDKIGCMSQANVDYVIAHNKEISPQKVEICPNCIDVQQISISEKERATIRRKYGIPLDKKVFVYGGNLGKPQGIPFLIECLKTQEKNQKIYFLIVGNGTEYEKLESYFKEVKPQNMKLMKRLPNEDYDKMVAACDVGMIFLDYRFTIPNFPSRLLSYMQAKIPVLAITDSNTDIGDVIVDGGFGWWCESSNVASFSKKVMDILECESILGDRAFLYLNEYYTVEKSYEIIMKNFS